MSALQPITGAVVVAIPASGKPYVALDGRIFDDEKIAAHAAQTQMAWFGDVSEECYAVATIGVVDGRKA